MGIKNGGEMGACLPRTSVLVILLCLAAVTASAGVSGDFPVGQVNTIGSQAAKHQAGPQKQTQVFSFAGPAFYPNDPYFFYKPDKPLYPGQWNLVNRAPSSIDYPASVAPDGHKTEAVTIKNAGLDANILGAWQAGYTGKGIVIGILDDGVELNHPDLDVRKDLSIGVDATGIVSGQTGGPVTSGDLHGTCVAGVAAAIGGNGIGVCGLAPHARVASIRAKTFKTLDDWYVPPPGYYWQAGLDWSSGMGRQALASLTHLKSAPVIQVKNSSTRTIPWSYPDGYGDIYSSISRMAANGVLFTVAAGNCRRTRQQDAGLLAEPANPYAIAVAALGSNGSYALYSNFGSAVFVTTLSESAYWNAAAIPGDHAYANGFGVSTTDLLGINGTNYKGNTGTVFLPDIDDVDYTSQFDGTSAAAPSLAGMLAVARQANPNMDVRMAKHLLARTSRVVDRGDKSSSATWTADGKTCSGWRTNKAGLHFNPDYGFGLPDVTALVNSALKTAYVTGETIYFTPVRTVASGNRKIPPLSGAGRTERTTVAVPGALKQHLESVEAYVDVEGGDRSEWQFVIEKDGTGSRLWTPANGLPNTGIPMFTDPNPGAGVKRIILTNAFWGEDPDGTWSLNVSNPSGTHPATWKEWGLVLHMGEIAFEDQAPVKLEEDLEARGVSLNGSSSGLIVPAGKTLQTSGDVFLNNGELEIDGTLRNGAALTVSKFDLSLSDNEETLFYDRGVQVNVNGGVLSGEGSIVSPAGSDGKGGVYNNGGTVRPGSSGNPGIFTLGVRGDRETNYTQGPKGALEVAAGSLSRPSGLVVNGAASVGGKLKIAVEKGIEVTSGSTLENVIVADSIRGDFDDLDVSISTGSRPLFWQPIRKAGSVSFLATPYSLLSVGGNAGGHISPSGEEVWYGFAGEAGKSYRVQLSAGAGFSADLFAGTLSTGAASGGHPLDWTCPADSIYFIRVNALHHSGAYVLRIDHLVDGIIYNPSIEAPGYSKTISEMLPALASQMKEYGIAGLSLALVDDRKVVWSAGLGYADQSGGVPYTADTLSQIASASKTFSAAAVMQLAEQGKLDIDKPLSEYLPQFSILQRFRGSNSITLRSMLCHHSGIPSSTDDGPGAVDISGDADAFIASVIRNLADQYTTAPVDTSYQYSNTPYSLLGPVVERVTGEDFVTYAANHLFKPMGMLHSSFHFDAQYLEENGLAKQYQDGAEIPGLYFLNVQGAGSVYTTASDMAIYIRTILNNGRSPSGQTIMKSRTLEEMMTSQTSKIPLDFSKEVGLSWDIDSEPSLAYAGRLIEKDGASPVAFCCDLKILPQQKLGVIFIFNTAGAPVHDITTQTLKSALLSNRGVSAPSTPEIPESPVISDFPAENLEALSGIYISSTGYDKVEARQDLHAVEWTQNAQDARSAVTLILYPRETGWFAPLDSKAYQQYQFIFETVSGQQVMVGRTYSMGENLRPLDLKGLWAVRFSPAKSVPEPWLSSVGSYAVSDVQPGEYLPTYSKIELRTRDNMLLLDTGENLVYVIDTNTGMSGPGFLAGVKRGQGEQVLLTGTGRSKQLRCLGRTYSLEASKSGVEDAGE
jgi:CubicO group peptidase (beta-lactamase class C family)